MTSPTYIILCRTVQSLLELVYEKKNQLLVFSGSRKIPTLGSIVQWETRQASLHTRMVGPRVGIFLSPLDNNDGFYLSHIPIPARGKDIRKRTAILWPHAVCTSIHDTIAMLKLRHHAASQLIQDFLEDFFMFSKYKMRYLVLSKKKNLLFV